MNETKVIICLGRHPVYKSIIKVFEEFNPVLIHERKILRLGSTKHVQVSEVPIGGDIYVLLSPLIELKAIEVLTRGKHAFLVEEYFSRGIKDAFVKAYLKLFSRYPFISQTKRTKEFLKSMRINQLYIPPAHEKGKPSKNRDIILFVARMVETKNPFFILDLAKHTKEEIVMVGGGELLEKVKERAKSLGNVEVKGYIERKELLDLYAHAKLLLHPAKKDPIGYVIIESLSFSTPVLTTKSVGASDFLPKEWVLDLDVKKWINKMENINEEDYRKAEEVFERENLNIESPYFEEVKKKVKEIIQGWKLNS